MRRGDEPAPARNPLRLRLFLSAMGLLSWTTVAVVLAVLGHPVWSLPCMTGACLTAVDVAVVVRRLIAGSHRQPSPALPPNRPLPTADHQVLPPARAGCYLILAAGCLLLLVSSWVWVAHLSMATPAMMSLAAVLMLLAAAVPTGAATPPRPPRRRFLRRRRRTPVREGDTPVRGGPWKAIPPSRRP